MTQAIFKLIKKDSRSLARRGELQLTHGQVQTPIFMPVAPMEPSKV